MPIFNFKKWRENERFTARDYMYERNAIVKVVEELEVEVENIDLFQIILSDNEPTEEITTGDIWLDS